MNSLFGAAWAGDGTIFFSDGRDGISKVSSSGGPVTLVTTVDAGKSERHLLPQVIPDAKAVLFTVIVQAIPDWDAAHIDVLDLSTGTRRMLIQGGTDARYIRTGHLVYMKSGTLMAVRFDARTLTLAGDPMALIEGVMHSLNSPNTDDDAGAGQFAISDSGALIYATGGIEPSRERSLVWADRNGRIESVPLATIKHYVSPRLSPDQRRIAVAIRSGPGREDAWIHDLSSHTATRMTFGGYTWPVIWSPDGNRLVFASNSSGSFNLQVMNADGSGQPERLTTSEHDQWPSSWTPNGNVVAFVEDHRPTLQIWLLLMDGDRKPKLFLRSPFNLEFPDFSPDGHWIAYVSSETGTREVYVQPYPGPGEKHRISTEGGIEPIWTADGRELLFRSRRKFYSATIGSLTPFRAAAPRELFETQAYYLSAEPVRGWDISPDGRRFLLLRQEESKETAVTQLQVVLNWFDELKAHVPTK